jgi:hypothetical protein
VGNNQDISDAKETYSGFLTLLKRGTIATVIVVVAVVLIIALRRG